MKLSFSPATSWRAVLLLGGYILCIFSYVDGSSDDDSQCAIGSTPDVSPWVIDGGFLVLFMGVICALGGLACVCEDYFIPALELVCIKYDIPDSVAGSSIMAAGADSPELFVCAIGLFASKSAIGIGTVIGSEIFNHMCISAGSVAYAEGGKLKMEWRSFTRECFFYFLSLLVFIYAVTGNLTTSLSRAFNDTDQGWDSCLHITLVSSGVLVGGQVLYVLVSAYFESICNYLSGVTPEELTEPLHDPEHAMPRGSEFSQFPPADSSSSSSSSSPSGAHRPSAPLPAVGRQSDMRESLAPRRSSMYNRESMGPRRSSMIRRSTVDRVSIRLHASPMIAHHGDSAGGGQNGDISTGGAYGHDEEVPADLKWKVWYYIMLPLKWAFAKTVPDVRRSEKEDYILTNITVSIMWIAVLAYCLLECLEQLGELFQIPAVIMGLTFSAVGTSFPNLYASMLVAREGKGAMAVSNAMGSNIFNIFIALGLPWFIHTAVYGPYDDLQNGGVVYLTLVLMVVLIIYYILIALNNWTMEKWMAPIFMIVYVVIIAICCVQPLF